MTKKPIDTLSAKEIMAAKETPFYTPGHPYLWVQGFGWASVGFYVCHEGPFLIRVAHCNHFKNAGKHYGALIQEGSDTAEWRYEGDTLINVHDIIRHHHFGGTVHRGAIRM